MVVLEKAFGDGPFLYPLTHGSVTRHYRSFRDRAEQEAASRIHAGVRFRWSIMVGEALGSQVRVLEADHAQPVPPVVAGEAGQTEGR